MSKNLLIVGNSNLPIQKNKITTAAGLRTWHFLNPILKYTDYKVYCFLISTDYHDDKIKKLSANDLNLESFNDIDIKKCDILVVNKYKCSLKQELKNYVKYILPDVVLSINTYPSFLASKYIDKKIPFWADLNGWIMAEAVSQSFVLQDDSYLSTYFSWEKSILKKADKFSVVSTPQKYALYGELMFSSRCNSKTDLYNFVSVIPNANEINFSETEIDINKVKDLKLKNLLLKKNKFILIQNGKFNSWLDVEKLFLILDNLIAKNENIFFVSTLEGIEGYDTLTFNKFKKLVSKSKYKDNYILLNGLDNYDLTALYKNATCGINIDKPNLESFTGARNRLNELMINKVPIITTLHSEISYDIQKEKLGIVLDDDMDIKQIIDLILSNLYDNNLLKEYAQKAFDYNLKNFNYKKTTTDLINWLKNPQKAPDFDYKFDINKEKKLKKIILTVKNFGFKNLILKLIRFIRN